jgi:hypothetical protein
MALGWHVGSVFTLHGVKVRLVETYSTGLPVNDDSVILRVVPAYIERMIPAGIILAMERDYLFGPTTDRPTRL